MASYGPHGGSPEPWPEDPNNPYRPAPDPYGPPRDPWGPDHRNGQVPIPPQVPPADRYSRDREWGHHNGYGPPPAPHGGHWSGDTPGRPQPQPYPYPGPGAPGYPPLVHPAPHGPEWGTVEQQRPPRRGRGRLVALLVCLVLLLIAGGAAAYRFLDRDAPATPAAGPSAARPDLTAVPTGEPAVTPAPESSLDPRFAKVGQCVRNEGAPGGKPKLVITKCAPKTYEVLRRFDGATSGEQDAKTKCARVPGYTNWYFFNSPLDTLDFVLCLKLR